ncbi:MAG: outer membrane lipoprotein carrier protein LolA [Azoarcus sp.]|jgi:outer membrane lipoprotein carrier protein|nr:outer membrane lipoprotein carrier protein LolA [Azoarcus sp.]
MKGYRGVLGALGVVVSLLSGNAMSIGAVDSLRQFITSTNGAEGEFRQTVVGRPGQPAQQASGKFSFSRPGKFRWEYDLPYPQLLVSDGKQLWSWDRDLRQVMVRPLGNALGATPAGILFGQGEIERDFILSEGMDSGEKLAWVEARPRLGGDEAASNGFQLFRFGFDGKRLQRLTLLDNFGQTTVIEFTALRINPSFAPKHFHFEPPAGVDILGDPLPP